MYGLKTWRGTLDCACTTGRVKQYTDLLGVVWLGFQGFGRASGYILRPNKGLFVQGFCTEIYGDQCRNLQGPKAESSKGREWPEYEKVKEL